MRFKLAVRFSGKLLDTYEFDKDQVTIGRAPDCDIVIDNLGVSRVHSQIERTGEVFVLKDMKSNNGTFVRGEKIQRYNLNHQDEFFLGKHSITFLYDEAEKELLEEGSQTEVMPKKDSGKSDIQGMTMSMDAHDIAVMGIKKQATLAAYLSVVSQSGVRQNIPITKIAIFFGIDPKCDYKVEGWFISKRHVLLLREETGFRLVHLGHKKPPKINGIEIDDQKLKHGDILDIENIRMTFNIGNP
ncbi:MAG: FHA domain-containing protein [Candidatus Brocadiae bacterium]|nr:FHA domain-containing protein [Candidatus Brocadiia bacterium]